MRTIPFAEFRGFLETLGYVEKPRADARVLMHPKEGMLAFRFYRDDEPVHPRDLLVTRKYLDLRGVIEAGDYDTKFLRKDKPAGPEAE
jgi:hypothetical protein